MTFIALSQAIDFIASCLENDRPQELADAFAGVGVNEDGKTNLRYSFLRTTYQDLRQRHQALDLRERYRGRQFPADEDTLHLGGHFAELGCINIRFIRLPEGWVLDHILTCR